MTGDPAAPALGVQVARLYFDRQLSKVEIAARLGISRFRVARLIDQALADGLVRIEFHDVPEQHRELARLLEERWSLDLCVVAGDAAEGSGPRPLVRLAAHLLEDLARAGDAIGIAGGATLADVVGSVAPRADPSIHVVQLTGSSARSDPRFDAGELARRLAEKLGATCQRLYAPAFVESEALRDALLRQPEIAPTVARYQRLSIALTGIDAIDPAPRRAMSAGEAAVIAPEDLREEDLRDIAARGGVGALALHAFDAAGEFVAPDCAARLVGISLEQLRHVPRVVAVAGGSEKATAVAGALATGIVAILVTDRAAAEQIAAVPGEVASAPWGGGSAPETGAAPEGPGDVDERRAAHPVAAVRDAAPPDRSAATFGPSVRGQPTENDEPPAGRRRPAREWRW